ncbi:ABC transporter substrate-binding protein [Acidobacteria bacterium AH-259-O06]|nr:ABC transporter substrate-binding protein [Acidobacteria bacterium AH-259-O06]
MNRNRLVFFIISLLILLGCSGEDESTPTGSRNLPLPEDALIVETEGEVGGSLHYPLLAEPSTFNFLYAQENRAKLVGYLTTATLLEFDPVQHTVTGGICREWKVSEDGQTVTLTLRKGVRFSDGVPLSAKDVLFTFEKIYEEGSKNTVKDALLIDGKPLLVTAIDSHTLEIKFPAPYAAAPYILTTVPIFPRHLFQEPAKKIEEYWNLGTPPQEMAGLGPFVLAVHQPGGKSVFHFNPHYWKVDRHRTRLPYLDELVFHYIGERNTQLLRFQAGELDLLDHYLRPEDLEELKSEKVNLQDAGPSNNLSIFWLNLNMGKDAASGKHYLSPRKREWFGNLKFRQAISTGISRDTIVRNVYLGHAQPAWSLVPSSLQTWYTADARRYEYNPSRSREFLQKGGFSWKKEGPGEVLVDSKGRPVELEILARADDISGKIAAIIQQDLEEIGMRVTVRQEELRAVISRILGSRRYDAAIMNIELPVEPVDHMNVLLSSGPMHMWNPNQSRPASKWEKRIDELMFQQVTTLDQQRRQRLYRKVQHILAEQVPIIPLVHRDTLIASKNRLKNVRPSSLFPYSLWNVWELWVAN